MTSRWSGFWRRRPTASPSGLTCRELVELVTGYLEGALDAGERARFEAHIDACPHCTAYLEQMRLTLVVVGELAHDELSDEMERELLGAFRDWKAGGGGTTAGS
jgi:anti-sigma factor RsiW